MCLRTRKHIVDRLGHRLRVLNLKLCESWLDPASGNPFRFTMAAMADRVKNQLYAA
jgi:hypothetical protein